MTVLRDLLDAAQLVGPLPWTADRDEGLLDAKGEPLVYERDLFVAAVNALPKLLDVADALATILHRVETRRTGIHIDGTEEWPTPLHKEIATLARAALDRLEEK